MQQTVGASTLLLGSSLMDLWTAPEICGRCVVINWPLGRRSSNGGVMNNRYFHVAALSIVAAFSVVDKASAATINFDDVASATNISNQYSGVTFGCISGTVSSMNLCSGNPGGSFGAGNAFAVAGQAASAPNVIGFNSGTLSDVLIDSRTGYLTAAFATPVRTVSIDALGTPPAEYAGTLSDGPFLQAFGQGGTFLKAVWYDQSQLGSWQKLTISDQTADIYYIAFSSQNTPGRPALYGSFDNLVAAVPEPETYAMLFAGLGVLGVAARRRKQRV